MARRLSDAATVVASDDVLETEIGREIVLLNLQDGVYYGLEEAGASIWKLLRHPVSVAGLCDAIVAAYDVEPSRCERDVRALVAELAERKLIHVRSGR
jgi:hypothetical protein